LDDRSNHWSDLLCLPSNAPTNGLGKAIYYRLDEAGRDLLLLLQPIIGRLQRRHDYFALQSYPLLNLRSGRLG
jgi:hypothetical protein